jgi:hypothetical protein
VKVWPKLFHNLRASRETELAATYPIHVVCEWIGNSAAIAAKHYLTVREEDFTRAAQGGAKSGALEAQNQAQQPSATSCKTSQVWSEVKAGCEDMRMQPVACDATQNYLVPPRGLEPLS